MPAKLTVLRGKRVGAEFSLDGKTVFDVGSAATSVVRFDEPGVAANHCRIFREDHKFTIFDLCGLGVSVNGNRVARSVLRHGDEITVGQVRLRFEDPAELLKSGASTKSSAGLTPAPAGSPGATLVCIEGADNGKAWPLAAEKNSFTVGRGMTAEVVVLDIKCSREHCRVERRADGFYLVDLGSTNGTKINGRKVKPNSTTKLSPGDQLKLGYSVLAFRLEGDLPPLPETTKMKGATDGIVVVSGLPPTTKLAESSLHSPPTEPLELDFGEAPTEPNERPAEVSKTASEPEDVAEASLRTFVFDDQPAFDPAPEKPEKQEKPAKPAKPEKPEKPEKPAKTAKAAKPVDAEDAAIRTFVFDELGFEEPAAKAEAPPPPPKVEAKPAPTPPPSTKPAPPPKPTPARKPAELEGEEAALRTFVFDDAGFDEAAKPEPPPAPPPPPTKKPAPATPAKKVTPPATPSPKALDGEDAALRTFVFDDAGFEEEPKAPEKPAKAASNAPEKPAKAAPKAPEKPAKAAPKAPEKPAKAAPKASRFEETAADYGEGSGKGPGGDPALRTFVFDEAPTFDEAPPPPPPPPAAGSTSGTSRYGESDAADPEEQEAAALRTFVFDDAPAFEAPVETDDRAAFRNVEVEVPDLDAPEVKGAEARAKKREDDDRDERPPEFQTQFMMKGPPEAAPATPAKEKARGDDDGDDEDEDGEQFHTMVFDKPPEF
jgi:pSer/pThr/pTyr-binding forkhead associated (FHA) protein